MIEQPVLETERLALRPYTLADTDDVRRLYGVSEILDTVFKTPVTYKEGMAAAWIGTPAELLEAGKGVDYAVTRRGGGELLGGFGLKISPQDHRADMWYWIGQPFWGQGYATEAGAAVLKYAFETLKLNRVAAEHFGLNPASGRVLQKLGMRYEGTLREQMLRRGQYEDSVVYGMLASEWREQAASEAAVSSIN